METSSSRLLLTQASLSETQPGNFEPLDRLCHAPNVPIRKVKYGQLRQNASKITKTPTHLYHRLKMSLWVDKHRPRTLEKLTYNHSLSKSLKAIVTALLSPLPSLS